MNRIPDRKKMRREYLDRKADAYARAIEGGLWIAGALLFVAYSPHMRDAGFRVWQGYFFARYGAAVDDEKVLCSFFAALLPAIVLVGTGVGLLGVRGIRLLRQARRAVQIPYVPPFTRDNLPAEEVLVRSAEQPNTPQESLLRAAAAMEQDPAPDQLLHVAPGAPRKPAET